MKRKDRVVFCSSVLLIVIAAVLLVIAACKLWAVGAWIFILFAVLSVLVQGGA